MIGWVFFRADNIVQASEFVQVLFGVGSSPICNNSFIMYINDYGYIIILSIIFAIPIIPKLKSILKSKTKNWLKVILYTCSTQLFSGTNVYSSCNIDKFYI